MAAIMRKRRRAIALQRIAGHVGIHDNEQADRAAKLGCIENQPFRSLQQNSEIYYKGRTSVWHKVQVDIKKWVTGHDLKKHIHRIGIADSPTCPLCKMGDMDGDHILKCTSIKIFNKMQTSSRELVAEECEEL
nr:uncharacterized protein LOC106681261 [Halyomorpha halys]